MTLPKDIKERIADIFKEKNVNGLCEICGKNSWSISNDTIKIIVSKQTGKFPLPPPHIPCFAIVCNNCGNMRLFALDKLGINEEEQGGEI